MDSRQDQARRFVLGLLIVMAFVTVPVLWFLARWTYRAYYPTLDDCPDPFAKPWRPLARTALSSILAVLILSTWAAAVWSLFRNRR